MPHYINMTADRKGRSSVLRCLFVCFFSIFRSQNVWQAWHDRDCPFRQDKAEEDRDKREKPSAHQREWVSLMCCMCVCFWTVPEPWSHPVINFPVRRYSSLSSAVKRLHPQQAEQLGEEKKNPNNNKLLQHQHIIDVQHSSLAAFTKTQACWPKLSPSSSSFSFPAIEQERKGDATPWLLSTWRKRSWDATAKSTFFWLSQYYNLLLCLQIRVLLSSLGCHKGIWHPNTGALLPLGWKKNFSLGACLALLAYS